MRNQFLSNNSVRAPQSTASGPEKVTNVDIVQRKGNIALVSKQKNLFQSESESWIGFQTFWSTEREAGKSNAELGYFVMDR